MKITRSASLQRLDPSPNESGDTLENIMDSTIQTRAAPGKSFVRALQVIKERFDNVERDGKRLHNKVIQEIERNNKAIKRYVDSELQSKEQNLRTFLNTRGTLYPPSEPTTNGTWCLPSETLTNGTQCLPSEPITIVSGAQLTSGNDAPLSEEAIQEVNKQNLVEDKVIQSKFFENSENRESADEPSAEVMVLAGLSLDTISTPKLAPFTGTEGMLFGPWLRKFEDIMRMRCTNETTQAQKAAYFIAHLDALAREKIEELTDEQKLDYTVLKQHLQDYFDSPQQRVLARQNLIGCQQEQGESCSKFAARLMALVRSACAGQAEAVYKERLLEEFLSRLRRNIRYFVRLDNPDSFEKAVQKSQQVENLLSEATASSLLEPGEPAVAPVEALANLSVSRNNRQQNFSQSSYRRPFGRFNSNSFSNRPQTNHNANRGVKCFACGRIGHIARECYSRQPQRAGQRRDSFGFRNGRGDRRYGPSQQSSAPATVATLQEQVGLFENKLKNSKLQIEALTKRNQELTEGENKNNLSSNKGTPPAIFALSLITFLSMLSGIESSVTVPGLICNAPTHSLELPNLRNCSFKERATISKVRPLEINLLKPNIASYGAEAVSCKILKETITYSINFFGAKTEIKEKAFLPTSFEHCSMMANEKRCAFGEMVQVGKIWRTQNALEIKWPTAPFGCCTEHTISTSNCLLINMTVRGRHNSKITETPIGSLNCAYRLGRCATPDGGFLLWKPQKMEECTFMPALEGPINGSRMGNIWLSESKELALSWTNGEEILDCGKRLTLTDQGFAFEKFFRTKRETPGAEGVVTSSQLASQLLAVEANIQKSISTLFLHTLNAFCDRFQFTAAALDIAAQTNPTAIARKYLNATEVVAYYIKPNKLAVVKCMKLPKQSVQLVAHETICYKNPSALIISTKNQTWRGFWDPLTNEVKHSSIPVDCKTAHPIAVAFGKKDKLFDPISGLIMPELQAIKIDQPQQDELLITADLPTTIFHSIRLTNWNELQEDALNDHPFELTELQNDIMRDFQTGATHGDDEETRSGFEYPVTFAILPSTFDIWVSVCCFIITIRTVVFILKVVTAYECSKLMLTLRASYNTPFNNSTRIKSQNPNQGSSAEIELEHVDPEKTFKTTNAPITVLSLIEEKEPCYFIAQISIKINGLKFLALVDTGAGITVGSTGIQPLLGTFELETDSVKRAVGIGGQPIRLTGTAKVKFEIGGITLDHRMYFSDKPCAPRSIDCYEVILGNDILRKLPSWSIDYENSTLRIGTYQTPIGSSVRLNTITEQANQEQKSEKFQYKIQVLATLILNPQTESFIRCKSNCPDPNKCLITTTLETLPDPSLLVAPAAVKAGEPTLLITNPTNKPVILFAGSTIAEAEELDYAGNSEYCF